MFKFIIVTLMVIAGIIAKPEVISSLGYSGLTAPLGAAAYANPYISSYAAPASAYHAGPIDASYASSLVAPYTSTYSTHNVAHAAAYQSAYAAAAYRSVPVAVAYQSAPIAYETDPAHYHHVAPIATAYSHGHLIGASGKLFL